MVSVLFTLDGMVFLLRWLHFFFAMLWIGHLYYFNFTQSAVMAEADAAVKSGILRILLPKALYWFRWGAMWTMVSGMLILTIKAHQAGWEIFATSWGVSILIGAILGLTMWANVWFLIWPKQKIVIGSAVQVANGGTALPSAPLAASQALLASRTNVLMSVPMLFFMGAASHLPLGVNPHSRLGIIAVLLSGIWLVIEGNAIKGKMGPLTTIKGVLASGVLLTVVFYAIIAAFV